MNKAKNYTGKEYYVLEEDMYDITMDFMYEFSPDDYKEKQNMDIY